MDGRELALRLARLRARSASCSPADAGTSPARHGGRSDAHLAMHLGGEPIAHGLVRVLTGLPLPLRRGRVRLEPPGGLAVPQLHALGLIRAEHSGDLVFLDTETSGLAGGTGTVAFMIGIARLGAYRADVTQWVLSAFSGEGAMLDALTAVLLKAEGLVSYNGKTFDVPLLRTRMALCARRDPFTALRHLDLLHVARRMPRRGCVDLRLLSVEAQWLGVTRENDLPGSAAPSAWRRWLTEADPRALRGVLQHNQADLLALIALTAHAGDIAAGLFAAPVAAERDFRVPAATAFSQFSVSVSHGSRGP